jgi:hypothetical protein
MFDLFGSTAPQSVALPGKFYVNSLDDIFDTSAFTPALAFPSLSFIS